MFRLSSSQRIILGLVSLVVSVLLVAGLCGFIPNSDALTQQTRQSFCESTAVSLMTLASRIDSEQLQTTLETIHDRNTSVLSIGVRDRDGKIVVASGPHSALWSGLGGKNGRDEYSVPITANGERWGQLEVRFASTGNAEVLGFRLRPEIPLIGFVSTSLFFSFSVFLKKVLKQLNPSKVVPNRVREALNALSEGLLVLDNRQTIVLANESFATATGMPAESCAGLHVDNCQFASMPGVEMSELPWHTTARTERPLKGVLLTRSAGENQRIYSVSTVPIRDDKNVNRGVVASFEDVTALHNKQEELRGALSSLRTSTEEVRKQNRELEWLATRDALTGCLNRRSFFREYERHWQQAQADDQPLSAMMVDIDFFKAVNDNHGHGMGDEVLRQVSATLLKFVTETDLVCRYGGEEFSVLMPATTIDEAEMRAERCRLAIKALTFPNLSVTASLGVSAISQNPESPQDMLD